MGEPMRWTKPTTELPPNGEEVLMAYSITGKWVYVLGCRQADGWVDDAAEPEDAPAYWARIPAPITED